MSSRPSASRVAAAFAAVYLIWGSTYLAIREAVATLPPFLMGAARFLIAGGLLYFWARRRGAAKPTKANWKAAAIVGGLLLFCGNGAVSWAETRVPSGATALLVAVVAIWMALWENLLGRGRTTALAWTGLVIGLGGVLVLAGPSDVFGGPPIDPWGAAALCFASAAWGLGSVLSRRLPLPPSSFLGTAMEMLAGGALLLFLGLSTGEARLLSERTVSLSSLAALAYLIVFGSLVGFTCYVWILKVSTPVRVSSYAYVNPIVAVLLGWLAGGESLTGRTVLAGVLILPAVALIILFPQKPPEAEPPA